ncbi:hypothetical protein DPEC_G00269540 [Dallia pectoralis]|uniref:Uncharacterized protein n=1 Tax=Dallia pectoralis TaxID=75939 RepID=A0ACC2FP62_DALPE|nr:hypothetical protein DPEC_G00269540 [Dallia pectoralis]
MWNRGGVSSALERAQAQLSERRYAKSTTKDDPGRYVAKGTSKTQGDPEFVDSISTRGNESQIRQTPFLNLSDLSVSSVDSVREHPNEIIAEKLGMDIPELESFGDGGGSRFLKKAPPRASQPPALNRTQPVQPKYGTTSQRSSQSTALTRLAQIENRIRNRQQARNGSVPSTDRPKSQATQEKETPTPLSPQSSSDLSMKGRRFLKKTKTKSPSPDVAAPKEEGPYLNATPLGVSKSTTSVREARRGVTLDSDEEDMRKLLGDHLGSSDDSLDNKARVSSSQKTARKMFTKSSKKHSLSRKTVQPHQALPALVVSPQRSALPGGAIPEDLPSDDAVSEKSGVSLEYKLNIMSLDDLAPVGTVGMSQKTKSNMKAHLDPSPGPFMMERSSEERASSEESMWEYESDFESEIRTETDDRSVCEISEHLGGRDENVPEVSSDREYSFSGSSRSNSEHSKDYRRTADSFCSRSSRGSSSGSSQSSSEADTITLSRVLKKTSPSRRSFREAAVQTQTDGLAYTWSSGLATLGPAVGVSYMDPTPVASHTVSAEALNALSTYSPAVFALNDMLRQQLSLTKHFVQTSRHLHSSLLQSLGPADYSYTTLEDTKEFIRCHKPPKLSMEEALQEVLQEMREYHYLI